MRKEHRMRIRMKPGKCLARPGLAIAPNGESIVPRKLGEELVAGGYADVVPGPAKPAAIESTARDRAPETTARPSATKSR